MEVIDLNVVLDSPSGSRNVLSNIDLSVKPRSVLGVIGESASGKTVLSRALVNWIKRPLRIASGKVMYNGRDILSLPQDQMAALRGREIAYIGANPTSALDPTVPVGHQILEKLLAVTPHLSRKEARDRVIRTLDAVRIPSPKQRFDEYPFQFSGGMMQRALIVDALAPSFGGRKHFESALKLTTYSYTPAWICGFFFLIPGLRFLSVLGLYGLYLLWLGLPVLMKSPQERSLLYAGAIVVCAILLGLIFGLIQGALFSFPRMN